MINPFFEKVVEYLGNKLCGVSNTRITKIVPMGEPNRCIYIYSNNIRGCYSCLSDSQSLEKYNPSRCLKKMELLLDVVSYDLARINNDQIMGLLSQL